MCADIASFPGQSKEADFAYRALPQNEEAEQTLLGALLRDNRHFEKIGDRLRPEHFFFAVHGRIFDAVRTLIERNQTASPVTLKNYFEKDGDLSEIGGAAYLADLVTNTLSIVDPAHYSDVIYELHLRRELIALGEGVVNDCHDLKLDSTAMDTIEGLESRLFALAETGEARSGFSTLRDSVAIALDLAEKAFNRDGAVAGVTTGLRDMDEMLGGLHPSDLLILAARPSMGKTALAVNFAYNAARRYAESGGKEGGRVGFFSLEMSSDQLATRILAERSGISGDRIRKGMVKANELQSFIEASHELTQVPLYIDDTPALSIGAVRTRARRLKRQHGLDMIIVDYLQLLRGSGSRQSSENRVVEVSEITRGLKAIAKELEVPVVALSQLSRAVEQREDKRPQLADLRESGSIEQDADVVMFIYREEYYMSRAEPDVENAEKHLAWQEKMERVHNIAEVIVAKQRHGPIGTVRMVFDPDLTRFSDLARDRAGF